MAKIPERLGCASTASASRDVTAYGIERSGRGVRILRGAPDPVAIPAPSMMIRDFLALSGAIVIFAGFARAQGGPTASPLPATSRGRVGQVIVTTHPPVIDGKLDDDAWKTATPMGDFVQREPVEGAPASERTEVRMVSDGEALYVAAWMYDRNAKGIMPSEKIRDVTLTNSDYFAFILDTYHDRQNGFLFGTTPSGIEHDEQVVREGDGGGVLVTGQSRAQSGSLGGVNLNWDASWSVATSTDSLGWYAEFRIPFATIRYGGGDVQSWGLNIMRGIRRKNEESLWSPVARQFSINRISQAGTLEGLHVPTQRIGTVTPYVLSTSARNFATDPGFQSRRNVGGDAKVGLTPSLTLDLTVNTDFAQVEVDEQRTNLTRFPVFFPEKRPFFLENAGALSVGTPQAVDLFFTRRIGIDSLGQVTPIVGGGRLTGRVGGLTVGALQMFTEAVGAAKGNGYSVVRVMSELSDRSRLGVIGVQRQRVGNSGDYNRVIGIDGRWGLDQAWTLDGWGSKSFTPALSGHDLSWNGRAEYRTGEWNNSVRVLQVDRNFNPEIGYMSRPAGYRYYEASVMRLVRSDTWKSVHVWNPHVTTRTYVGDDGYYQSGQIHVDLTEVELNNGARIGPEVNIYHEGLKTPFTIAPGFTRASGAVVPDVVIPAGAYDWPQLGFDLTSDPSAPLSMIGRADVGPFYNGTRNGGSVTLTARRGSSISTALQLDYQDVRLPAGDFVRTLAGVKLAYFFTPRVFIQSLTQYNNAQRVVTANARLAWLRTGGTGLYVVLNDGEQAEALSRWQAPLSRSLTVKYAMQLGSGSGG